ncbi:MAG: hypothetical protein ACR2HN_08485 [Tepidiformaceae bacterium]
MAEERGIGKCPENHIGSYGYPTRPHEPYPFCSQCGTPMVWACPNCSAEMPDDSDELTAARFCRHCGTGYFGDVERPVAKADAAASD